MLAWRSAVHRPFLLQIASAGLVGPRKNNAKTIIDVSTTTRNAATSRRTMYPNMPVLRNFRTGRSRLPRPGGETVR